MNVLSDSLLLVQGTLHKHRTKDNLHYQEHVHCHK